MEVRLAEIDRRLREIQADLVPGRTPRETRMPPARPPPPPPPPAETKPPDPPPPRMREERSHGRSGPLAEALASARRRRAQDAPEQPEPPLVPPPEPRPQESGLLTELQSSLLAATRDLLDGYERAVSGASAGPPVQVTVSAGPFSGTAALHAFEGELRAIPGVGEVTVLGYDGPDRAILEVQLERATPRRPST